MKAVLIRWATRIALFVVVVALSVAGTLIWTWSKSFDKTPVELTAAVPGANAEAQRAVFPDRVRREFPVGSSEQSMTGVLKTEGFSQVDWGGATGTEHQAVRHEHHMVCSITFSVRWRATADGRISAINGEGPSDACL